MWGRRGSATPAASVVIGGIISSTLFSLLVLPALYRIAHREAEREDEAWEHGAKGARNRTRPRLGTKARWIR